MKNIFKNIKINKNKVGKIKNSKEFIDLLTPYASLVPLDYVILPRFINFRVEIEDHLENLFKKGAIDEIASLSILDNLIDDVTRQALEDLDIQKVDHRDSISKIFTIRQSNQHSFEEELSYAEDELSTSQEEFNDANQRYKEFKFKKNGGKNNEE